MTIESALKRADELAPNAISTDLKLYWLSELEGKQTQEDINYDNTTATDTELKIPHPYDSIYISYLCCMLAMAIGDTATYNTYYMKFAEDEVEYKAYRTRTEPRAVKMNYGK